MITLDVLVPGESGKILAVGGEGALRHRLLDMGLTPKTIVKVEKIAPEEAAQKIIDIVKNIK